MTPQEAITYIEYYGWSTTRLGLERTRELLDKLGNPQKKLKFIHVAGSNGKGSTCAMLDSILRHAGFHTGLYTSPYIQDFCERVRVNGKNISGEDLARITERVRTIADSMADHPSQFELVTAIAIQYFAEQHCDFVVLEVGMGGALDSTNVIDSPEVAVITNIGLEHTEYLGNTLEEIAAAKGGIIKHGCTAVCYACASEVMDTLKRICKEQKAEYRVSSAVDLKCLSSSLSGQCFRWKDLTFELPLLGEHQMRNAGVALETISALRHRGWEISDAAVKDGLHSVIWPARFELLSRDPLFILDGGHNPQCAKALAKNIADYLPGEKCCFLMGVLKDKDYEEMLDLVAPFAASILCFTPDNPRALSGAELSQAIVKRGIPTMVCSSVETGIRQALNGTASVIAFGSLYLAGQIRTVFPKEIKAWQRKKALAARAALSPEERRDKSLRICQQILDSKVYRTSKIILLFKAFGSEADLSAFESRALLDGKKLLYPYCVADRNMLALCPNEGGAWEKDAYGIRVPVLEESAVVSPEEIDLVLCPCSAFDARGHRLGMGAGYYDRFLPRCLKAKKLLVAFEAQRMPSVYTDCFDIAMDGIATENAFEIL